MKLPVAHVQSADPRGAGLEKTIGEPTCRRPDIEAVGPCDVDRQRRERIRKLFAAARDEARTLQQLELRRNVDLLACLRVTLHSAGEHERLRLRTALGKTALDHENVKALLHSRLA
jgi:hypothetical protein